MVSVQLIYSTAQGSYSAWIEDMVIEKTYRSSGVGKRLLNNALEWAKNNGASRAQLLVDVDNDTALGYYQHLGWQTSKMGMLRLVL